MTRIEDQIGQNEQDIARALAARREPARAQNSGLITPSMRVDVNADITVSTRPLNDSLIVGHPDNGWGNGLVGDHRGAWTQRDTASVPITRAGQLVIADALLGGSYDADRVDVDATTAPAWQIVAGADLTIRATLPFDAGADDPTVGIATRSGETLFEYDASATNDFDREVRLEADITFTPDTHASAAVTDDTLFVDALTGDRALRSIAMGTDDTQPTTGDTALGNQVFSRKAERIQQGPQALLSVPMFAGEPTGQTFPVNLNELGLLDGTGDLVARRVDTAIKRERQRVRIRAGFRIT